MTDRDEENNSMTPEPTQRGEENHDRLNKSADDAAKALDHLEETFTALDVPPEYSVLLSEIQDEYRKLLDLVLTGTKPGSPAPNRAVKQHNDSGIPSGPDGVLINISRS